jgi:lipid-A-disaccharide synthase
MVVAYRIEPGLRLFKWMLRAKSIVLSNLVLGENVIPELIDRQSTPTRLAAALLPLLDETPERAAQLAAFARLDGLMTLEGTTPSARAAGVVVETVEARQRRLETGT